MGIGKEGKKATRQQEIGNGSVDFEERQRGNKAQRHEGMGVGMMDGGNTFVSMMEARARGSG